MCSGDTDCAGIECCLDVCDNCDGTCLTGHTTGISETLLLDDCAARQCATQCTGATALPQCDQCLYTTAPSDVDACEAEAVCASFYTCVRECGSDGICVEDCDTSYGDANAQAVLNDLENGPCADACGSP